MKRVWTHELPIVCIVAIVLGLTGCEGKRIPFFSSPPLPESVYKAPENNEYKDTNVGVFRFDTGSYPVDIGIRAANSLHQKLLKRKAFDAVFLMADLKDTSLQTQLAAAEEKGLALIITGTVLYYIEGSRSQSSRVEQEIRAFDVKGRNLVWYAKTTNSDAPNPEKDLILFRKAGAPPRPVTDLMNESLDRMVNLFFTKE